jgi:Tol biopolymer transport system component
MATSRSFVRFLAIGSLLALLPAARAAAVSPGANGVIAYVAGSEVRTVAPDGTGIFTVTALKPGRRITDLAWSPDGQRIAIADRSVAAGGAAPRVLVVNAIGTDQHVAVPAGRFPMRVGVVSAIAWSPDGKRLAICADGAVTFVAAVDGDRMRQLDSGHPDCATDWSPDGRQLVGYALLGGVNGRSDVIVMRPDGDGRHVIVSGGSNLDPSWSPDGDQIVFSRTFRPLGYPADLFTVASIGLSLHRLTNTPARDERSASWSPDGTRIVYLRTSELSMWTIDPAGGEQDRVLPPPSGDEPRPDVPAWQPLT